MTTPDTRQPGDLPADVALVRDALKTAVDKELDKKRKLGQYYAWVTDHGTELIGPDAPTQETSEGAGKP